MSAYLLTAAIDHLRAQFTRVEVATLQAYGGEFNAEESDYLSYAAPAILVTVLGWRPTNDSKRLSGRNVRNVRMAAFVAFKHAEREYRLSGAMALAERAATALRLWVPQECVLPVQLGTLEEEPACENMYSRSMDARGQALWLISWDQAVKPLVPLPQLYDLLAVDICDTTRQGVVPPPPALPPNPNPLVVTEQVDFAPLP